MRRYRSRKHYTWSSEVAYTAGLIASDGCLANDGRHINITSKDVEIINSVQLILDTNVKVGMKRGSFAGTESYSLQFSNVSLYDFLLESGITPAKSFTIGALTVPDVYYSDFLRGYFDGDGTVYGYWDVRWPNSFMFYASYISASAVFLDWIREKNTELAGTSPGKIKPAVRALTLTYAKTDSRKLFHFMYANGGAKLSRKYDKFLAFLEIDSYRNKVSRASAGIG